LYNIGYNKNKFKKLFDTKCEKNLLIINKIQYLINLSQYDVKFEDLWKCRNKDIIEKISGIVNIKLSISRKKNMNYDICNILFDFV
jgi:hypothetical protein